MRYQPIVFVVSLALVMLASLFAADEGYCLTAQDVPAAEMPSASPGAASSPTPDAASSPEDMEPSQPENYEPQEPTSAAGVQDYTSEENPPANDADSTGLETGLGDVAPESQPAEGATVPPALDSSALTVGPELGGESLDPEITKAVAPAMAASLRLTESARQRLTNGQVDDAMRDLARAVSLDPADAFAYYYL